MCTSYPVVYETEKLTKTNQAHNFNYAYIVVLFFLHRTSIAVETDKTTLVCFYRIVLYFKYFGVYTLC